MTKVRDRFDAGKQAQHDADKRALHVQWGNQRECERYTLAMALQSPERHVPRTFAHEIVVAFAEARDA